MTPIPYDQRLARLLARPLARTAVSPNQVTLASLALALGGAGLFAGGGGAAHVGAAAFALARFLDHVDGELARQSGRSSRLGYYFDYLTGGVSYAALFLALGIGLTGGPLGPWAMFFGLVGAAAAALGVILNLRLDRLSGGGEAVGYPAAGGFELEDGIYLILPVTWAGLLAPFLVAAGVGAIVFIVWTASRLVRRPVA